MDLRKCFVTSKSLGSALKIPISQALKIQVSEVPPWEVVIQVGLGQDLEIIFFQYSQVINSDPFIQELFLAFLPCARTILSARDMAVNGLRDLQSRERTVSEQVKYNSDPRHQKKLVKTQSNYGDRH